MDLFGSIASVAGSFLGAVFGGDSSSSSGSSSPSINPPDLVGRLTMPMMQQKTVGQTQSQAAQTVNGLDTMKAWASTINAMGGQ